MELLFESHLFYSEEILYEAYQKISRQRNRSRAINWGFILLFVTLAVVYLLLFHQVGMALLCLLGGGFLFLVMQFSYRLQVRRYIKNDRGITLSGQKIFRFYHDRVVAQSAQSSSEFYYHQMTGYWQTPNLHLITFGNSLVIVDKRGFVLGDPVAFIDYLSTRVPEKFRNNLYHL